MQTVNIFMFLKRHGVRDFPITNNFIFLPVILAETKTVRRSLDILLPDHFSSLNSNILLGRILKKNPVSSAL